MSETPNAGQAPEENPSFNATSLVNISSIDKAELSSTASVFVSVALFIPEVEAQRVGIDAARSQGEARRVGAEVARIAGWPSWVNPNLVHTIQQLGCHEQVREMMEKGFGLVAIANKIHQYGELLSCTVGTIENYLTHYRATVPKHLIARKQLKIPEAEQSLRKGIDVRQKLEDLYNKMESRIEIGFNREKQMSFLMTGMEKQFEVAAKLLKEIYQFDKEQGFGEYGAATRDGKVAAPVPQIDLDKVYSRTGINETLQDPAKRMRVISVVERLLDLGNKAEQMGIAPAAMAPHEEPEDGDVIEGESRVINDDDAPPEGGP